MPVDRALDLEIVMEGIETDAQSSAAQALGGTVPQGYLFHRPMSAADLLELLHNDQVESLPDAA